MQFVEDNLRLTSSKKRSAIGANSGKNVLPKNTAVFFDGKAITDPKRAANNLSGFMVNSCKLHTTKLTTITKGQTAHFRKTEDDETDCICEKQVEEAIKIMSNSRAIKLNGLSSFHLKRFGKAAGCFVAWLKSQSIETA